MANPKTLSGNQGTMRSEGNLSEGERLERQMWEDMQSLNMNALEKKIAPEFQSIHMDGPRNRAGEIELIKDLNLGKYVLSNFKTTQQDDTIVVTYMISADETIDDRHLQKKASSRLSVWKKNKQNQWQWIAHANLISLGKKL
jgi:hypothetical protein